MNLRILGLPSSPKGEIVGVLAPVWRYGTGVVFDGNSLWLQISVQALRMKEILYTQVHLAEDAYTRGLCSKVAYAYTRTFMHRKARTWWETYFWSMVVSPWNLNLWFWTMVSRQKC